MLTCGKVSACTVLRPKRNLDIDAIVDEGAIWISNSVETISVIFVVLLNENRFGSISVRIIGGQCICTLLFDLLRVYFAPYET